jgi:hypothetical protein
LIRKNTLMPLWSFQGAHGHAPVEPRDPAHGRSLKTQQREVTEVVIAEVDVLLGDSNDPDENRQ